MIRLISVLLLVVGLAVGAIGLAAYLMPPGGTAPETRSVASAPPEAAPNIEMGTRSSIDEPLAQPMSSTQSEIASTLRTVPIAHETPDRAVIGKPFDVTLAIDGTGSGSAADALPGRGNIVEAEAEVAPEVRAVLAGTDFDIELLSPAEQALSPTVKNTWRWKATPLSAGALDLTIEIYALQGARAMPVRTYRDTIVVEVSRFRQILLFAQDANPLFMVLGGFGSAVAGLFGAARFFRKS